MAFDPGEQFAYNTVGTISLGQVVENASPLSLIDFGSTYFLAPLGISRIEVEQTPTGLPDLGRGVFLTTRDLLKLGQLYLDHGEWQGQTLVTSDWISRSTTAYSDIGWSNPDSMAWNLEGYGYQWWTGCFDIDGARVESFAAWGFGEQWLMVVPEYDLVVAINSHGQAGTDAEANQALSLIRRILLATDKSL
jgi:CubicO group peptidase (beta-lactamase class C family)